MYFAYGWPRVAFTDLPPNDTYVYLRGTEKYIFAVSRTCVQLWTGGLYRIKLSECVRTEEDVKQEGLHMAALWSPAKATLAVLTSENYLHLYAIHLWKDNLLHPSCNVALKDIQKADIYLKSSIRLDSETRALSITGDSRLLLVGFADGTVASLSWSGKMKDVAYPLDDATDPIILTAAAEQQQPATPRLATGSGASAAPDSQQQLDFPATAVLGDAAAVLAGRSSGGGSNSAFAAAAVLTSAPSGGSVPPPPPPPQLSRAIVQMSYCEHSRQVVMVLADGACAVCGTSDSGLSPLPEMCFGRWLCGPQHQAVCAQVSARAQLIAVGRDNGDVELFRLHRSAIGVPDRPGSDGPGGVVGAWEAPVRTLSLDSWGHKSQQTGPVSQVEWSPDGRALAVGFAGQGVVVWSPSGCRLMCSLRQPPPSLSSYPSTASHGGGMSRDPSLGLYRDLSSGLGPQPQVPLDGAVSALCWGPMGYQLEIAEVGGGGGMAGAGGGLTEVTFAHSLAGHHRVARGGMGTSLADEEMHVLQAHDRLVLIREAGEMATGAMPWAAGDVVEPTMAQVGDLTVSHVPVPHSYVAANWPLQRTAISASGTDIAVAGRNGLAVYNRPTERWRLFGDISQERQVSCRALGWLSSGVLVACSGPDPNAAPALPPAAGLVGVSGGTGGAGGVTGNELLLLPRYHLDLTSLLARYPLQQPPIAMDCLGSHILLASEPLEITLLEVSVAGELSPTGNPRATITSLRDISMFVVGRYLSDVALVPLPPAAAAAAAAAAAGGGSNDAAAAAADAAAAPRQCVLLRWGGMLSVLDLEKGSELALATEVEAFWLSDAITCQTGPFADGGGLGVGGALGGSNAAGWAPGSAAAAAVAAAAAGGGGAVTAPTGGTFAGQGPEPSQQPPAAVMEPSPSLSPSSSSSGVLHPASCGTANTANIKMDVEMPWWLYGPAGMQLCFPSLLGTSSMAYRDGQDIELEFDQEVYPVGISLADDAIVGITQRIVRGSGSALTAAWPGGAAGGVGPMASAAQLPCFHPIPESQPVLPCLLRRLLQRGAFQEAVSLARRHARGPHFARSLEWLLFTALEIDTNTSSLTRPAVAVGKRLAPVAPGSSADGGEGLGLLARQPSARQPSPQQPQSLLAAAADLVHHFPNLFAEVVVSVARKTDAALWPPLFEAVGSPSRLLDGLVEAGELASAACFLLIIDRLEGAFAAQEQALRLMRSSLLRGQYPLCCELLRFVVPPSEQDMDSGRLMLLDSSRQGEVARVAPAAPEPSDSGHQLQQQLEPVAAKAADTGQSSEKPSTSSAPEDFDGLQAGGGAGGGGRTWLGWLMGYSADPVPAATEPPTRESEQQDQQQWRHQEHEGRGGTKEQQQQQQQLADCLAVAADPDGAPVGTAAAPPTLPRAAHAAFQQAAAGGRLPLAPNSPARPAGNIMAAAVAPSSPVLAHMLLGAAGGAAPSAANAKAACGLVSEHAWRLLEGGHLAALAQLQQASSFLPGGLPGLMRAHRGSMYAAQGCAAHSATELLSALTRAVSELPVWSGDEVEALATGVEALCREVGAVAWAVAMAVVLVDTATVTAFRREQPGVWAEFVQMLRSDTSLSYLWEIVELLTEGAEGEGAGRGGATVAAGGGGGGAGPAGRAGLGAPTAVVQQGLEAAAMAGAAGQGMQQSRAAEGPEAGTASGLYAAMSGDYAASVGRVELRPLTGGQGGSNSSEIEEASGQSTPRAMAIPGPSAAEVSIPRG